MTTLRYTLLTDGSSDRVLLPLIDWLLRHHSRRAFNGTWADLRHLVLPPQTMAERIQRAVDLYPCDLLFVHRDAERLPRQDRVAEIRAALGADPPAVCVVPVRMQEAWLLFDESAIREAAGRPNGNEPLHLPPLRTTERVPNPKTVLRDSLLTASGLHGRRRRQFPVTERIYRLAVLIRDFSPLRQLAAFDALEREVTESLLLNGWV